MVRCWAAIKDSPKWQDLYVSWTNNEGTQSNFMDLEGGTTSASSQAKRLREVPNPRSKQSGRLLVSGCEYNQNISCRQGGVK
jgi:hypothetical protein